ncbi:MAG: NAD(P)/FAD-dependent oxidoreductase, partial [Myxococcota bacterium]|nr:NAD(P)/FAD-dependent oxidoreductase [Myxococcota bacterium]
LEDFGLIDKVEQQGFARKTGGTFVWGRSQEPWDVLFGTNPFLPYPYAYHVDREVFDDLLLQNARESGVHVVQGVNVQAPTQDGARVTGVRLVDTDGEERTVRARYVVDCSGPKAVLGRQLTHREYDRKMRQVAYYGYYDNVTGPEGHRATHVLIEANKYGWFWYIPQSGGTGKLGEASVGLVTGQEFSQEVRAMGMDAFYERALAESPFMQELLGPDARRIAPLNAISDWAYTSETTSGPGWYLAGDAASFLDPLLSSGCTMAMLAGYSASVCIHTSLQDPSMEGPATAFYAENYRRMYEVTRDFLHYFYAGNEQGSSDAIFWKARKTLQLGDNVGASQAFCFLVNTIPANPHPALKKQIHMYLQFMDQIQHPTEELETELGDRVDALQHDEVLTSAALADDAVPQPNGALEASWQIDGESHTLKPIRGIVYDQERPVFSSTSSWLLGRNIHALDDDAADLLAHMDGRRTWGALLAEQASASGRTVADLRAQFQPVLQRLTADNLILVRAEA